jgi:general secretion pathway protein C
MSARWWSFGVWALVAGSALFWGLRLFVTPAQAPVQTRVVEPGAGGRGDLTRVFGPDPVAAVQAPEPEPVADARFQLIGVVSPRVGGDGSQGVALIAVDGKPAKAYRVGSVVDGQNVLQSVRARGAALGPRGGVALIALDLAPPAAAAFGSLPDPSVPADPAEPTLPPSMTRSLPPGGPMRPPTLPQAQPQADGPVTPAVSMRPVER